ncbi:SusD/RagB family nutrient-binding outer membrane lipoprotein [Aquimarina sediminis]|uniref:SusD/RagB family nutrient-binding outer membrane lipoprotein n=1 Tax=Aquimarina sediminis TaxID=2070536 RepID=UPI000CA08759|nr:SusD/RagB family nutrient-binding outer membrane lipoprotein [Aquimarina sediminis]
MKKYNITKKILKHFTLSLVLTGILMVTNSCETTELDHLNNPSRLTPDQASEDLFINAIQLGLAAFFDSDNTDNFNGVNEFGMQLTRMVSAFGTTYQNLYGPSDLNGIYADAYTGVMIDIRTLTPLAEEKGLYTHLGVAQVAEAYIMMTLVDYFGDFPYEEAFLGAENISPALTPGEDIYASVEQLLIDAVANFNKEQASNIENDFFYDGDEEKWIKLANTLRIKLYTQSKLVDANAGSKINAILTDATNSGGYISSSADDFQFNYSTTDVNPDSRHPLFGISFDNGPADYIGNDFMNRLVNQKDVADASIDDPRTRYYIYRQELDFAEANTQTKPCVVESKPAHYSADDPFCNSVGDGYWGRDNLDQDGIPPDQAFRTLFGVYPVGGPFDDGSGNNITNRNTGLIGAGSSMIMLSSYVQFMLAETALTSGVTGDARDYLEAGMTQSINKVMAFGEQLSDLPGALVPTAGDVTAYKDAILAKYDATATDDEKLDIIIEQYYLALWQNGVEAYNTYRRTGKPDLQPGLLAAPGVYMRSLLYPDALVNRNSSVSTKPISTQVFWDTNPANFVD